MLTILHCLLAACNYSQSPIVVNIIIISTVLTRPSSGGHGSHILVSSLGLNFKSS